MERRSGILMHITSLPGAQGCGTIGREAYAFADFLSASSQSYWQILPTCPVDETGSPYHSVSARAGCHLLIDLEPLVEKSYHPSPHLALHEWIIPSFPPPKINFFARHICARARLCVTDFAHFTRKKRAGFPITRFLWRYTNSFPTVLGTHGMNR